MHLPRCYTGWPDANLLDSVLAEILDFVDQDQVDTFYVGHTNDLVATRSRHNAADIFPVYQTESVDSVLDVEGLMIDQTFGHEKSENDAADERGGVSEGFVNYVYVAVWWIAGDSEEE